VCEDNTHRARAAAYERRATRDAPAAVGRGRWTMTPPPAALPRRQTHARTPQSSPSASSSRPAAARPRRRGGRGPLFSSLAARRRAARRQAAHRKRCWRAGGQLPRIALSRARSHIAAHCGAAPSPPRARQARNGPSKTQRSGSSTISSFYRRHAAPSPLPAAPSEVLRPSLPLSRPPAADAGAAPAARTGRSGEERAWPRRPGAAFAAGSIPRSVP